jgi:uncharacterized phiE125 gp8 family phage protein
MRVVVVEAPAPVVTWEMAEQHLKLDGDDTQKDYVEGLIAAATGLLDGPEGWLGRAIGMQTLEAYLPTPLRHAVVQLPYRPIVDLVQVETQAGAAWEAMEPAAYSLDGIAVSFRYRSTTLTAAAPGGLRIRYRAGYEDVPAPIRAAILMMTSELYRNRGSGEASFGAAEMLLSSFRVYR